LLCFFLCAVVTSGTCLICWDISLTTMIYISCFMFGLRTKYLFLFSNIGLLCKLWYYFMFLILCVWLFLNWNLIVSVFRWNLVNEMFSIMLLQFVLGIGVSFIAKAQANLNSVILCSTGTTVFVIVIWFLNLLRVINIWTETNVSLIFSLC